MDGLTQEQPAEQAVPTETMEQRMDRLGKELDEWCKRNAVAIVVVAAGRKSGQLSPVADFQPDTHVFVHALQPRGQQ